MAALGAVFGTVYGWERPGWFAPADYGLSQDDLDSPKDVLLSHNHAPPARDGRIKEKWSFRRSNYFEHVGNECRNVFDNVGLLDMSAFAKYEVSGTGAEAWLDSILANRIPKKIGRLGLCHLLTKHGGVRSEFTVYRTGNERFYLVGAGAFERHDWDVLQKLAPKEAPVQLQKITTQMGVLVIAGPRSRELLQTLTDSDLSNGAFPWLSGQFINVGHAQAHALRVNFVGELGFELHHPIEMQNTIFDLIMDAGKGMGIKPFGIKAMDSLRLEKSYRLIPRELSIEYAALESGLERFVHLNKGQFLGRDGLVEWQQRGFQNRFVTMEIHGIKDADARGNEPIYDTRGRLVGRCTSGGYGWRLNKSLALGMVRPELGQEGGRLKVKILGENYGATVIPESPFDPENARLRS
jgi:dimethylglycine dehydrogenase